MVGALAARGFLSFAALLMLHLYAGDAIAAEPASLTQPELLTNLVQLRRNAEQRPLLRRPFHVEADVYEVDLTNNVLVLRDETGVEFIQLDLQGRKIEPGARISIEGSGYGIRPKSFGLAFVPGLLVDNDGYHGLSTESGTAVLHAGPNPIAVQWFNRDANLGLTVEYEGPGLRRQRVPSSALSRATIAPETGATNFVPGLDFQCCEGAWVRLPDFARYRAIKSGVTTNFDLDSRSRDEYVGMEFRGFIDLPREGVYTFFVGSDDGSRLLAGGLSLKVHVLNQGPMPPALARPPSTAAERSGHPWVTLEGRLDYAGVRGTSGELAMRVGDDDVRAEVFEVGEAVPNLPVNSRVRVTGFYQDIVTAHGSRVPGLLLVPSWKAIRAVPSPGKDAAMPGSDDESASLPGAERSLSTNQVAVLTTAAEIKALPAEVARQRLQVSVRGVVTAVLPAFQSGAVIQDGTKGIYISLTELRNRPPLQRGDFCQVEGVTGPGLYAPVVTARRVTHLGPGVLPKPLHASRDQLINGSLDTQYAEIDGVVIAVHNQEAVMLTEGGRITVDLSDFQSEDLASYANALIRLRGCVFAVFDGQTHGLDARFLRLFGGSVQVLQPAPRDFFEAPQKSIGDLLLYDAKTTPYRRLKVSGQVLYSRGGEHFINDGTNGLRVTTGNPDAYVFGDRVEAVGFLEVGGPAPELKEAVMRQTGQAPALVPIRLPPDRLLAPGYAGKFVQAEALLMDQWRDGPDYVLELQAGFLLFRARLDSRGQEVSMPQTGSRLDLTGVYSPQGKQAGGDAASGFELLLYSPTCIRVLATPPWWTLRRVLALAAILAASLCAVLVWNNQLQRKVLERGLQLETEIHNRQRAELQRTAEAERSRIARDLHDELGTGLTEMSLLASAGLGDSGNGEQHIGRFHAIAEKARGLVSGLDVIVWAIDPKRNSLQSFADYVGSYARELLSASTIVCRLKIPIECDPVALPGPARHSLFLAVKEALNNVIRHALATEVELQMVQSPDCVEIVIADNGRGFDPQALRKGHGLTNLRERLESLHGECRIESQPGSGTTVRLIVPLPGEVG